MRLAAALLVLHAAVAASEVRNNVPISMRDGVVCQNSIDAKQSRVG